MTDDASRPAQPENERRSADSPAAVPGKIFVLDTNVLLHDPLCLHKFEDNTVALPVEVLEELDRKKTAPGELGFAARQIHRDLRSLFDRDAEAPRAGNGAGAALMSRGLPNGGRLVVAVNESLARPGVTSPGIKRLKNILVDPDKMDSRILATVIHLQERFIAARTILVTKDANMALKALALDLEAQDYMNDKVAPGKVEGGCQALWIGDDAYERFLEEGAVDLAPAETARFHLNEYLFVTNGAFREPARFRGGGLIEALVVGGGNVGVKIPKGARVQPQNAEQRMLMDALLDEDIKLVTCRGKAGTGKTLVTMALALYQTLGNDNLFERVCITRPLVHIGRDTGALPGSLDDKLAPYIAPFYDNLEILFSDRGGVSARRERDSEGARIGRITSNRKRKKYMAKLAKQPPSGGGDGEEESEARAPAKPYQFLFDYGLVEVEAMTFIRGRSLAHTIFIIDEAQNLTPHEAKTIVSRMGEGSKVVLLGDPCQVDNVFLDANSNGLVHTAQRLKGTEITAHVELSHGVRSELAELAADFL